LAIVIRLFFFNETGGIILNFIKKNGCWRVDGEEGFFETEVEDKESGEIQLKGIELGFVLIKRQ
jgi:hypothetical protein